MNCYAALDNRRSRTVEAILSREQSGRGNHWMKARTVSGGLLSATEALRPLAQITRTLPMCAAPTHRSWERTEAKTPLAQIARTLPDAGGTLPLLKSCV